MTRPSRLNFGEDPDPDLAHQWDTKRKLFNLAEVRAPPSAVLVTCIYSGLITHCARFQLQYIQVMVTMV